MSEDQDPRDPDRTENPNNPKSNDDSNDPKSGAGSNDPKPGAGSNDPKDQPQNPQDVLAAMFGQLGGNANFAQLLQQVQQAMGQLGLGQPGQGQSGLGFHMPGAPASGGQATGASWSTVTDLARKTAATQGADPTPNRHERDAVADAVRLAQTWLDSATELPASSNGAESWSRADWIEETIKVWQRLIEPVASSMAEAMANIMAVPSDTPEASMLAGMEQMLKPMLRDSGAQMFGMQAGQAIGKLAGHVLSGTDNGLPLMNSAKIALLPSNIDTFADGLDASRDDVLIYLALREAARQRLFAHASWLAPQVLALVEAYAKEITIDTSRLEQLMNESGGAAPGPEMLQKIANQLQDNSLFTPARTPEQDRILERLETLLALVEGWVDDVVEAAAHQWLPQSGAFAETMRRRRAAGGPAEATLAQLVGLELRPRRVREAAQLWRMLRQRSSAETRDAVWSHPDLLPGPKDLADPLGFTPDGVAEDSEIGRAHV